MRFGMSPGCEPCVVFVAGLAAGPLAVVDAVEGEAVPVVAAVWTVVFAAVVPLDASVWAALGNGGKSGAQPTARKARAKIGVSFIMLRRPERRDRLSFRTRQSGRYTRVWSQ